NNGAAAATADATRRGPEPGDARGSAAYDEIFVRKLYHIFHDREPDRGGFEAHLRALRAGTLPHELVENFAQSDEFALRLTLRLAQRTRSLQRALAGPEGMQRTGAGSFVGQGVEAIRHRVWLPDERPRILLLKLDHIGDFAMTVDSFQLLRDTWPKADITLVCGPWNKSFAEQLGLFNTVLCCDFYPVTTTTYDRDAVTKQGIAAYCALPLGIYDLAIDLRIYDDNRFLLSHTDTTYRAGYAADGVALDLALPAGSESEMTAHIGGRTLALAAAVAWTFGVPAGGGRDRMLNGREPVRLFTDGVVVGISPGTRNALRSWGRERFADLARILSRTGDYRFALIGGNDDRADTQFIGSFLPRTDFIDLAGTLAIGDIPPVFAGLDVFVGGETGTTHM
ncbi:MAG: glycosyltransferase family 9 protein, partial [Stellaceae bacterium]